MTFDEMLKSIETVRPFYGSENQWPIWAEHEEIGFVQTDLPLDLINLREMIRLGWFQNVKYANDDTFEVGDYDPGEPWHHFV